MPGLSVAQESVVQRYCQKLPKEFRHLSRLLETATSEPDQTRSKLADLNSELHRMAGSAYCMGYAFIGRELSELNEILEEEMLQGDETRSDFLKGVAIKFEHVARLRSHVSPFNSSLLYNDGIEQPLLKRSKRHMNSVRSMLARQRVLFADDDLSIRMLMRDILTSIGVLNVATTANGEELLDLADQFSPTIIITDWCMEPLNGLDVLRHIRRGDTNLSDNIRVIFLSTKSTLSDVQEAVGEGADHFLAKPFSRKNVERALLHVLPLSAAA